MLLSCKNESEPDSNCPVDCNKVRVGPAPKKTEEKYIQSISVRVRWWGVRKIVVCLGHRVRADETASATERILVV